MAGVIADFVPALKEIAKLGSMNNKPNGKYDRGSWKLVKNPEVLYSDAFWRHLLEGPSEIDPETSMPHDVAIAWNALALICFRLEREAKLEESSDKAPAEVLEINKIHPVYTSPPAINLKDTSWLCSVCGGRLENRQGVPSYCINPNCISCIGEFEDEC